MLYKRKFQRYHAALLVGFLTLLWVCIMPLSSVHATAYGQGLWFGAWATEFGELRLRLVDGNVRGSCREGKQLTFIEGSFVDKEGWMVRGTWYNSNSSGTFELEMMDDGAHFKGWRDSSNNVWNGTRQAPKERKKEFEVLNNSPYDITAVFIAPAGTYKWKEVLKGSAVSSGNGKWLLLKLNDKFAKWDIKIVDASGKFKVFSNQDINNDDIDSMHYYYKDNEGWIGFAAG